MGWVKSDTSNLERKCMYVHTSLEIYDFFDRKNYLNLFEM